MMKEGMVNRNRIYTKDSLWLSFLRSIMYFLVSHPSRYSGILKNLISSNLIPKPQGPRLVHTIYGFDIICMDPANDLGVEKPLYFTGTYEAGTLNVLKKSLREGDIFFDIGANIGLMSIFSSIIVGNKGAVYSFEPLVETFKILQQNIEINNIKNVHEYNLGMSNKNGKSFIYTNPYAGKGSSSFINPQGISSSEKYEVNVVSLDHFLKNNNIKNIRMLKIDVEGWELEVLKGADSLLHSYNAPIICIEYSKKTNDNSSRELYSYIKQSCNYLVYKLQKGKEVHSPLIKVDSDSELPYHDNLFCFQQIHLKTLPINLFKQA